MGRDGARQRLWVEEVRRKDDTKESETEELKRPRGHLLRIPSKCQGLPVPGVGRLKVEPKVKRWWRRQKG